MHRVLISGKGGRNLADLPLSAPWVTVHDETVCTPVRDTVNNTGERERGREKDERRDPVEFADKSLLAVSCKIKNVDLLTIHFKLIVE